MLSICIHIYFGIITIHGKNIGHQTILSMRFVYTEKDLDATSESSIFVTVYLKR